MSRVSWFAGVVMVLVCQLATAADAPKFSRVLLPDAVRFVQAFSEDQQAGTMLFDNFVIATEIGKGALPSVATKKFTYVLQPEADQDVCVRQNIRGFVSTQGSGTAALVIHAGGKTTVVDLAKATKSAKDTPRDAKCPLRQQALQAARTQGLSVQSPAGKFDDFLTTVENRVAVGKPLQITVVLLTDRLPGDDGSGAMLAIDSVDFVVKPAKAAK